MVLYLSLFMLGATLVSRLSQRLRALRARRPLCKPQAPKEQSCSALSYCLVIFAVVRQAPHMLKQASRTCGGCQDVEQQLKDFCIENCWSLWRARHRPCAYQTRVVLAVVPLTLNTLNPTWKKRCSCKEACRSRALRDWSAPRGLNSSTVKRRPVNPKLPYLRGRPPTVE